MRRAASSGLGGTEKRYPAVWLAEFGTDGADAFGNVFPDFECHERYRTARGHISIKASKDGILRQVVPEYERLRDRYELLWDMPDNQGYLQLVGVMQKFVDQAISANTNYDPSRFPSGKVPMTQLLKDILLAYKLGIKTLYYQNTRDGAEDAQDNPVAGQPDDGCDSGACRI